MNVAVEFGVPRLPSQFLKCLCAGASPLFTKAQLFSTWRRRNFICSFASGRWRARGRGRGQHELWIFGRIQIAWQSDKGSSTSSHNIHERRTIAGQEKRGGGRHGVSGRRRRRHNQKCHSWPIIPFDCEMRHDKCTRLKPNWNEIKMKMIDFLEINSIWWVAN